MTKKVKFLGFSHTDSYRSESIPAGVKAGGIVEVEEIEAARLLRDFAGAGQAKGPAFEIVK